MIQRRAEGTPRPLSKYPLAKTLTITQPIIVLDITLLREPYVCLTLKLDKTVEIMVRDAKSVAGPVIAGSRDVETSLELHIRWNSRDYIFTVDILTPSGTLL
jgi:hypothetical protein